MTTYLTNELVPRSLQAAGIDIDIVDKMTDIEFNFIQEGLVAALNQGAAQNAVVITDPETNRPFSLNSFLRIGKPGSGNEKILAFSFSHLAKEALFPIFGILLAAFNDQLGIDRIESAAKAGRALWTSTSILKSPDDNDAIEALHALGKSKILLSKSLQKFPTNKDISEQCTLTLDGLAKALAKLDAKNIISIKEWGSVNGRYEDLNNTWTIRF